jgi:hypothetical protein
MATVIQRRSGSAQKNIAKPLIFGKLLYADWLIKGGWQIPRLSEKTPKTGNRTINRAMNQ